MYSIKSPLASITASEPGAGTPDLVPVQSGENLSDGGHQAGPDDTVGISIRMFLKFTPDKIAHQLKGGRGGGCATF